MVHDVVLNALVFQQKDLLNQRSDVRSFPSNLSVKEVMCRLLRFIIEVCVCVPVDAVVSGQFARSSGHVHRHQRSLETLRLVEAEVLTTDRDDCRASDWTRRWRKLKSEKKNKNGQKFKAHSVKKLPSFKIKVCRLYLWPFPFLCSDIVYIVLCFS